MICSWCNIEMLGPEYISFRESEALSYIEMHLSCFNEFKAALISMVKKHDSK